MSFGGSTSADTRKTGGTLVGLKNLGNTCYQNATLQALRGIFVLQDSLFRRYITHCLYQSLSPVSHSITTEFIFLMWDVNQNADNRRTCFSPVNFRDAFVGEHQLFDNFQQHDAHEFITHLLDSVCHELHVALTRSFGLKSNYVRLVGLKSNSVQFGKLNKFNEDQIKELNPIERDLKFSIGNLLKCARSECSNIKTIVDNECLLLLAFPPSNDTKSKCMYTCKNLLSFIYIL